MIRGDASYCETVHNIYTYKHIYIHTFSNGVWCKGDRRSKMKNASLWCGLHRWWWFPIDMGRPSKQYCYIKAFLIHWDALACCQIYIICGQIQSILAFLYSTLSDSRLGRETSVLSYSTYAGLSQSCQPASQGHTLTGIMVMCCSVLLALERQACGYGSTKAFCYYSRKIFWRTGITGLRVNFDKIGLHKNTLYLCPKGHRGYRQRETGSYQFCRPPHAWPRTIAFSKT